jgi:hypothetical protein
MKSNFGPSTPGSRLYEGIESLTTPTVGSKGLGRLVEEK